MIVAHNASLGLAFLRDDPIFVSGTSTYAIASLATSKLTNFNKLDLPAVVLSGSNGRGALTADTGNDFQVRHLTALSGSGTGSLVVVGVSTDGGISSQLIMSALTSSG